MSSVLVDILRSARAYDAPSGVVLISGVLVLNLANEVEPVWVRVDDSDALQVAVAV
jgi:hypothetical protein